MKKLFSIILLLISITSIGQLPNQVSQGNVNTETYDIGIRGAGLGFHFRTSWADTTALNSYCGGCLKNIAGLEVRTINDLWMRSNDLQSWNKINGGGGGGVIVSDSAWSLTGNYLSAEKTMGSLNDNDVVFKRNNIEVLRMQSPGNIKLPNTNSGTGLTGVIYKGTQYFMHDFRLVGTNGDNLFMGGLSGNLTMTGSTGNQGSYNTGFGTATLYSNTTGYRNTAVGTYAMQNTTSGFGNTAIGASVLFTNTTGERNTAGGFRSMTSNTSGFANVSLGFDALAFNTTADHNTAVGLDALYYSNGSHNTAVGDSTLWGLYLVQKHMGYKNTAIGSRAGYYLGDTYPNFASIYDTSVTFLGANASRDSSVPYTTSLQNMTVIGYNARGFASNQVVLGNDDVTTTKLKGAVNIKSYGIGTHTGTPATYPAFNSSGDLIESATPYSSGWNLNGNTVGSEKWFGTIDNYDIVFKRNNTIAGRLSTNSTSLGNASLLTNSTGDANTSVGSESLISNISGNNNIALGFRSGQFSDKSNRLYINSSSFSSSDEDSTKSIIHGIMAAAPSSQELFFNALKISMPYIPSGVGTKALRIDAAGNVTSADTTGSGWSLSGNSTTSGVEKLGTTSNTGLDIITNNTTAMYIDSTGNVGVGTSATTGKLHVVANSIDALFVQNSTGNVGVGTTNPSLPFMVNTRDSYLWAYDNIYTDGFFQVGSGIFSIGDFNSIVNSTSIIANDPAATIFYTANNGHQFTGNVGIGTTPTEALDVAGKAKISDTLFNAGNTYNGTSTSLTNVVWDSVTHAYHHVPLGGGSGISGLTTNELVYGNSATTIASLPVATYPNLTELSYAKGVTSAIQTQLNGKQATITFGTGVQTALGVNIGSAGAPVLFNGALGTPSSGTLTNATGLPVGGISATGTPDNTTYLRGDGTWSTPAGGSGITVGTTTVTGGGDGNVLRNNAGVVGEYTTTGTGTVIAKGTSPSFTTSIITPVVTTASSELLLSQSGDTYGTTSLALQNRNGSAGALFSNSGLDLVDFGFVGNSAVQNNLRMEHRGSDIINAGNTGGEFQFLSSAGSIWFASGAAATVINTGSLLFTDNTQDIGASGATRPRTGYFGTNVIAGAGLAVGGSSIAASAVADLQSTTKGFLPPRMTATQASAISSPAEGLMLYVTDTNGTFTSKGWWGYNGAAWEKLNN